MSSYLFKNGPIYTMRGPAPATRQAPEPLRGVLLTRAGLIEHLGPEQGLDASRARGAEVIDLGGRPLLPGFCDAHLHLMLAAEQHDAVDCRGLDNLAAVQERVRHRARDTQPEQWITGCGWEKKTLFSCQEPSPEPLDVAAPHNPVFLLSKDVHSAWLNTLALQRLLALEVLSPKSVLDRRQGLVLEDVIELQRRLVPAKSHDQKRALLGPFVRRLWAHGITAVHSNEPLDDMLVVRDHLQRSGERVRTLYNVVFDSPDALREQWPELPGQAVVGWLCPGGAKLFLDGTLGSLTAALSEPYTGTDDHGMLTMGQDELTEWLRAIVDVGTHGVFHVIGDRALGMLLSSLRQHAWPSGVRHRLEHAQILPPKLPDGAFVDLVLSGQPSHMWGDREIVDRHLSRTLGQRCAYAYRTMMEQGALLVFGSDAPVEELNPWKGIQAAVTRLASDRAAPWIEAERLTLYEAIAAHTAHPAKLHGECFQTGVLAPGRRADLVVLNEDPFTVAGELRQRIHTELTFVDGELVHSG